MENELLEKSMAELRRARAAVEGMHEEIGSERAVAEQALDAAKCQLAMAIVLAGGSNWVIEPFFPGNFKLTKIVRGSGGMDICLSDIYNRESSKHEPLRVLWNLLTDEAGNAELEVALMAFRGKFDCLQAECDNLIAIRGRFFRFVDGKYEVMC